jgi:hypothetical protein
VAEAAPAVSTLSLESAARTPRQAQLPLVSRGLTPPTFFSLHRVTYFYHGVDRPPAGMTKPPDADDPQNHFGRITHFCLPDIHTLCRQSNPQRTSARSGYTVSRNSRGNVLRRWWLNWLVPFARAGVAVGLALVVDRARRVLVMRMATLAFHGRIYLRLGLFTPRARFQYRAR